MKVQHGCLIKTSNVGFFFSLCLTWRDTFRKLALPTEVQENKCLLNVQTTSEPILSSFVFSGAEVPSYFWDALGLWFLSARRARYTVFWLLLLSWHPVAFGQLQNTIQQSGPNRLVFPDDADALLNWGRSCWCFIINFWRLMKYWIVLFAWHQWVITPGYFSRLKSVGFRCPMN